MFILSHVGFKFGTSGGFLTHWQTWNYLIIRPLRPAGRGYELKPGFPIFYLNTSPCSSRTQCRLAALSVAAGDAGAEISHAAAGPGPGRPDYFGLGTIVTVCGR